MWHVVYGGPCFSFSLLALLADCMDVVVLIFCRDSLCMVAVAAAA